MIEHEKRSKTEATRISLCEVCGLNAPRADDSSSYENLLLLPHVLRCEGMTKS